MNISAAELFAQDHAAWMRSLGKQERRGEPHMEWGDLGMFAKNTYNTCREMASAYDHAVTVKKAPKTLPDDCTAQGFYKAAVEVHRRDMGYCSIPFIPTPWERLSAFTQFLFKQMAARLAGSAGFTKGGAKRPLSDGLGDDLDDGLGGFTAADDGLGGADVLDDLDDGLGGVSQVVQRLFYHPESDCYLVAEDEFDLYDLESNMELVEVTGNLDHVARHEAGILIDDGLGDGL